MVERNSTALQHVASRVRCGEQELPDGNSKIPVTDGSTIMKKNWEVCLSINNFETVGDIPFSLQFMFEIIAQVVKWSITLFVFGYSQRASGLLGIMGTIVKQMAKDLIWDLFRNLVITWLFTSVTVLIINDLLGNI